ncbi:MAG: thiamine diphosphokinase [Synergistaceae bacterium]|nr:thiamine diphosphokinase [Synergistaceae bacterium]MBR0094891.1 thiamine diphosphokinase [Synergistaceae bacterium]
MRCVIVGGAEIKNYELIRKYFEPRDFFIYCDCGLRHEESLRARPDLVIGDFDSHERPDSFENVITLPRVKDDTDTIFAVKEAIRRGFDDVLMVGATGGRQDHNLGNIYALLMLSNANVNAVIVDDYSEMRIIRANETVAVRRGWKFFSLINIAGVARGITITGAKYNLNDAEITPEFQYGISNEVEDDCAEVSLREGSLLLVCVR